MNRQTILCLFLLSVLWVSCADKGVTERLAEVERMMDVRPDSALTVLQQLESLTPATFSQGQHALWCLLMTQARDKNVLHQRSDSLIRIAVSYYERKSDRPRLMKAYYYMAVIHHDAGDVLHAQDCYLKALEVGRESDDHAILGRIYSNLGMLYNRQNIPDSAVSYQERAMVHFTLTGDTVNIGIALRNIGRFYAKDQQLDSAITYYTLAIPFLSGRNRSSIYNEMGGIYKRLEQYPQAFAAINSALETLMSRSDTLTIYYNLGDLYRQTQQYDSAYHYLSLGLHASNIDTKAGTVLSLSLLEEQRGNWEANARYQKQYRLLQDSISRMERAEALQRVQSQYDFGRVEKERFEAEQRADKNALHNYMLLAIIIGILLLFTLVYQRQKRINRERREKELRILEQEQHAKIQQHLAKQREKLNVLRRSPFYQRLLTNQAKMSQEEGSMLEEEMAKIYPDFKAHLMKLLPDIDSSDVHLCYLTKLNIPPTQISHLFCISKSGIPKRKERLYEKMNQTKGSARDFDIFMIDFW